MLGSIVFCVILHLLSVEAQTDDNYVFFFKRAGFFDTDILRSILPQVDHTVESLRGKIEANCGFTKAVEEYEALQKKSPRCVTLKDIRMLKDAKTGFATSRDECLKAADCKSPVAKVVEEASTAIRKTDTEKWQEVAACGLDNPCKYKVYIEIHNDIFSQYLTTRPRLRLMLDQNVASLECAGAVVNCMVERNAAALRSLYEGSAKLKDCQGSSYTSWLSSYLH